MTPKSTNPTTTVSTPNVYPLRGDINALLGQCQQNQTLHSEVLDGLYAAVTNIFTL